ncbi:MAG: CGNR zinc finger domain-containing protein [Rhodobacteraceae bacterium]|nr:CGNR zinc finger domain-containing protein [Paracoccaceae bacterium]
MSYSDGHPLRLVGGRIALDFLNTADWSGGGAVVHEKLACLDDVKIWAEAQELGGAGIGGDLAALHALRADLRQAFLAAEEDAQIRLLGEVDFDGGGTVSALPLEALITISALSILSDKRERRRLKQCPAENCGWLFIDETKNSRRRWCSMESCGNKAKASRHYARSKGRPGEEDGRDLT